MWNREEARCTSQWKKCKQLAGTCWLAIWAHLIGQADSRIWRAGSNVNEFKTSRAALNLGKSGELVDRLGGSQMHQKQEVKCAMAINTNNKQHEVATTRSSSSKVAQTHPWQAAW